MFPVLEGANIVLSLAISSLLEINFGNTAPSLPSLNDGSISVWYESLDQNGFQSNTHEAANKLCESKGEKINSVSLIHIRIITNSQFLSKQVKSLQV